MAAGLHRRAGAAAVGPGPSQAGWIGHPTCPCHPWSPCPADPVPAGTGVPWPSGDGCVGGGCAGSGCAAASNLSLLFCRVPWAQSRVGDPCLGRGSCSREAAPAAPSCCPGAGSGWVGGAGAAPSPCPMSLYPPGQRCPAAAEPKPRTSHGETHRPPWGPSHGRLDDQATILAQVVASPLCPQPRRRSPAAP